MSMPEFAFDFEVLTYLNAYARISPTWDLVIAFISSNHLVKGGLLMALVWWAWFREPENSPVRSRLLSTLIACIVAIGVARLLALNLPFRIRPMHNEGLTFLTPYGLNPGMLSGWSSFPSDHAVLFYTLATGLFCASRKLGLFALVYTTLVIALPRIYLGLHYPTDIIAGALLGMTLALGLQHSLALEVVGQPLQRWSVRKPALFYSLFFLFSYQVADMFDSTRALIKLAHFLALRLMEV